MRNIVFLVEVAALILLYLTSDGNAATTNNGTMPKPDNPQKLVCKMDPEAGMCRSSFKKYYYKASEKKCDEFNYGGCGGNPNNFDTREQCEMACKGCCD